MTRSSNLSSTTTTTSRRRNSPRNYSTEQDNGSSSSVSSSVSSSTGVIMPSRIPIKSPARPSTSTSTVGGMAVAYSPRSDSSDRPEISDKKSSIEVEADQGQKFNDSFYARKLVELRNAMEMLKTPPSVKPIADNNNTTYNNNTFNNTNNNSYRNINNSISYTPIKSSGLATADYINNSSFSFTDSINHHPRRQSSSSFFNLADDEHDQDFNLNTEPVSMEMLSVSENDGSLLDAYNDEREGDDVDDYVYDGSYVTPSTRTRNFNNNFSSLYTSPNSNRSSPYISSDELRHRLQATREAFQKSLEAQKLSTQLRQQQHQQQHQHLMFNRPQDLDSFFSTCDGGFDSDLSTDTLRDTRKLLDRIKREAGDLIESDFEEVSKFKFNSSVNVNVNVNVNDKYRFSSGPLSIVFYFLLFTLTFFTLSFLFINYSPISALLSLLSSLKFMNLFTFPFYTFKNYFRSDSFLEKCEEFLNYLLRDD